MPNDGRNKLISRFPDAYFERIGRTDPLDGIVSFYRDLAPADKRVVREWLYTFSPTTWQAVARVHLFGSNP